MLMVDTNVLVNVVQDDPQWADWSIGLLRAQAKIHELVIIAVVYAELSVWFSTIELLNCTIATMQLTLRDIPPRHSSLPAKPTSISELCRPPRHRALTHRRRGLTLHQRG